VCPGAPKAARPALPITFSDASLRQTGATCSAIPSSPAQNTSLFSSLLGHRIYSECCCQCLNVQNVGSCRVLSSSNSPEGALWTSANITGASPALRAEHRAIRVVIRFAIVMPSWFRRVSDTLPITAASQRLTKSDATEVTLELSPASIRRSMPRKASSATARYCSRERRRSNIHRNASEYGFLDGGHTFSRARGFNKHVRSAGAFK
jgi:hypothetical protein